MARRGRADELPRFSEHSRETFDAVLDLSARVADDHFAPHAKKSDRNEPVFDGETVHVLPDIKAALQAYAEAGLFAATFDEALGGAQIPALIHTASTALTMAANIATAAYPMLTVANARLLASFGLPGQIETFARPLVEGRWFGTMCLSEPQAGSSLSDVTTRAVTDGTDAALGSRYWLFGNKMWISGGDHDLADNIVHLVLAKVPSDDGRIAAGMAGVSLFVVPKWLPSANGELGDRNDITVMGLNHKMGYRGTTNCLLAFGEGSRHRPDGEAGAIGFRVGEVGQGLAIMFQMMNEARIAVGVGAAALACRGYHHSLVYARERVQGRPANARGRNAEIPQAPIITHPGVRRMLLTQKVYAEGALALVLYCARLVDEAANAANGTARREAEAARFAHTRRQKLAGGIRPRRQRSRDPDTWRLRLHPRLRRRAVYRDNRLNPIHEGTHGIQAIDLVGRKILRDSGAALGLLSERMTGTIARAGKVNDLTNDAAALDQAWTELLDVVACLRQEAADKALHNASAFLSALGHVVVGWLWLDQALAAAAVSDTMREIRLRRAGTSCRLSCQRRGNSLRL